MELTSSSGAGWGSVVPEEEEEVVEEEEAEEAAGAGCCCARIFWSTCTVKMAWLLLQLSKNKQSTNRVVKSKEFELK